MRYTVWRRWTEQWLVPLGIEADSPEAALHAAMQQPCRPARHAPATVLDSEAWVSTSLGEELLSPEDCERALGRVATAARSVA